MNEKVAIPHPEGKAGVSISRMKYDPMRAAIVEALRTQGDLTFHDLIRTVQQSLAGSFDGSISWYATWVKMDLEAHGVVVPVSGSKPARFHLAGE